MTIGQRIISRRKVLNISQMQLAQFMDVSRQAVSKWENDLSAPDTLHLIKLADILETDVEYLATGSSQNQSSEENIERKAPECASEIKEHFPSPLLIACCSVLFFIMGFCCAVFILQ